MSNVRPKSIAKNTIILYIRMMVLMLVSLYTSRVVLNALGVTDFGIYNVVGGVVVLFTFLNNGMTSAIQRFYNFYLGKKDKQHVTSVFTSAINLQILLSIFVILLGESIGLWLFYTYIKVPDGTQTVAFWVYQLSLLSSIIGILTTPFRAMIISYEHFSFYAYIGILESVLKLGVAFMLLLSLTNRLVIYAFAILFCSLIISIITIIFCKKKFSTCNYNNTVKDKSLYTSLISFSGWSFFGAAANAGANQGLSIVLNYFFGVIVNAAMGIATQVSTAIYSFVSNFQTAFVPQLMKLYGAGEYEKFNSLIIKSSKYSYYLLLIIALPIIVYCPLVLQIWLGSVPNYTVVFCRLMIIYSLIDALQGPLWYSVQAGGNIKTYQLIVSFFILSNIPIAAILFYFGYDASTALIAKVFINAFLIIIRLRFLYIQFSFPVKAYIKTVIIPISFVSLILYISMEHFKQYAFSIPQTIASGFFALLLSCLIIYCIGISKCERQIINSKISELLKRNKI